MYLIVFIIYDLYYSICYAHILWMCFFSVCVCMFAYTCTWSQVHVVSLQIYFLSCDQAGHYVSIPNNRAGCMYSSPSWWAIQHHRDVHYFGISDFGGNDFVGCFHCTDLSESMLDILPETSILHPCKSVVARWNFLRDCLFSGAMLVLGSVFVVKLKSKIQDSGSKNKLCACLIECLETSRICKLLLCLLLPLGLPVRNKAAMRQSMEDL